MVNSKSYEHVFIIIHRAICLYIRILKKDSDQRVRDECQSTFTTIGLRIKKGLLPHLKTILSSWLMAQCDSYAPAASKAKSLFTKLFIGKIKQAEVVYFARNEIMSTLADEISQCSDVLKDK
jgi:E3 ubiquitin-protein ligase listerin